MDLPAPQPLQTETPERVDFHPDPLPEADDLSTPLRDEGQESSGMPRLHCPLLKIKFPFGKWAKKAEEPSPDDSQQDVQSEADQEASSTVMVFDDEEPAPEPSTSTADNSGVKV